MVLTSRQTCFPLYTYPPLFPTNPCFPIRRLHRKKHVWIPRPSSYLTHQRVLPPLQSQLRTNGKGPRLFHFLVLQKHTTSASCQEISVSEAPSFHLKCAFCSSTFPRPRRWIVRSCIYQQCDRQQGLQKMRHEWGQGPKNILRADTTCEGN